MAKSIQALREERNGLAKNLRNHYDKYDGENAPKWDAAAQETYDGLSKQIENVDSQIKRLQEVLDVESASISAVQIAAAQSGISVDEANHNRELGAAAFATWMRGGVSALTQEQRTLLAQRQDHYRVSGAMSTTTGSEGGYLTANEFAPFLTEAMRAFGGVRALATVIQSDTGSQMDFPTTDATSEEGEIVGENAAVSVGETSFGTIALNVQKYSSKSIAIPFELLQDSRFDLEAYIRTLLAQRLGRITNRHYTVGTGTGQPRGIITAATVGKVGASQTALSFNDLIDLEHSVDPMYRVNKSSFMFHDLTLAEIKKLKDDQERPLWLPGVAAGEPDRILNRAYVINQHMATMAADARSVAFGDFSKYVIRDVMQVQLFRMTDSKYTEKGQVGFLAFMSTGGNMVDVGGAVKTFRNASA